MNILIAIAHQMELEPFKAKFQVEESHNNGHGKIYQLYSNNGDVRLVQTGIGLESAKRSMNLSLQELEGQLTPDVLINFGTCGAIHPDRKIGELVVGEQAVVDQEDSDPLRMDSKWTETLETYLKRHSYHYIKGTIFSTDRAIADKNLRRDLYRQTNAQVVDMECYALAEIAQEHQLPLVSVKYITDNADPFAMKDFMAHVEEATADLSEVMFGFVRQLIEPVRVENTSD